MKKMAQLTVADKVSMLVGNNFDSVIKKRNLCFRDPLEYTHIAFVSSVTEKWNFPPGSKLGLIDTFGVGRVRGNSKQLELLSGQELMYLFVTNDEGLDVMPVYLSTSHIVYVAKLVKTIFRLCVLCNVW